MCFLYLVPFLFNFHQNVELNGKLKKIFCILGYCNSEMEKQGQICGFDFCIGKSLISERIVFFFFFEKKNKQKKKHKLTYTVSKADMSNT